MKGGYTKTRSNLQKKMREHGFRLHEREKVKKKVRFRQNLNQFSHRLLGTKKKSLHEIDNKAFRRVKKSKIARRRKKQRRFIKAKTKKGQTPAAIANNFTRSNSFLNNFRSSIKPLKIVYLQAPTSRALSRKTGSKRYLSALVSNALRRETRRAKSI